MGSSMRPDGVRLCVEIVFQAQNARVVIEVDKGVEELLQVLRACPRVYRAMILKTPSSELCVRSIR